jgi:hypothetical protein
LELADHKLTGTIPASLANLKQLTSLYLWGNLLTGLVPPLPFAQYKDVNGGACRLSWGGTGETNRFKCPLPVGSAQCRAINGFHGSGVNCVSYE